jgi:hypothetical protein
MTTGRLFTFADMKTDPMSLPRWTLHLPFRFMCRLFGEMPGMGRSTVQAVIGLLCLISNLNAIAAATFQWKQDSLGDETEFGKPVQAVIKLTTQEDAAVLAGNVSISLVGDDALRLVAVEYPKAVMKTAGEGHPARAVYPSGSRFGLVLERTEISTSEQGIDPRLLIEYQGVKGDVEFLPARILIPLSKEDFRWPSSEPSGDQNQAEVPPQGSLEPAIGPDLSYTPINGPEADQAGSKMRPAPLASGSAPKSLIPFSILLGLFASVMLGKPASGSIRKTSPRQYFYVAIAMTCLLGVFAYTIGIVAGLFPDRPGVFRIAGPSSGASGGYLDHSPPGQKERPLFSPTCGILPRPRHLRVQHAIASSAAGPSSSGCCCSPSRSGLSLE